MFTIPETFKNDYENYITSPKLKSFIKENKICKINDKQRLELIDELTNFANSSVENLQKVLNWIDDILLEGIKDVYIKTYSLKPELGAIFASNETIKRYLSSFIAANINPNICSNRYTSNLSFVKYQISNTVLGRKVTMYFCRKIYVFNKISHSAKPQDYPVIAELYCEGNWLAIRAKNKTDMYVFSEESFDIFKNASTNINKQIRSVEEWIESNIDHENFNKSLDSARLKNKLFNLMHKYTYTPNEIQEKMDSLKDEMNNVYCSIMKSCNLFEDRSTDVIEDVKNTFEKYISITWPDDSVFKKDRDAYPVKLIATDEEESKVEQTASEYSPLQSRAVFFDNKKMLYKKQRCDGITFVWQRTDKIVGLPSFFVVRISINTQSQCVFKFTSYTGGSDIENVLFSVISD